jgi:hypothetical protein
MTYRGRVSFSIIGILLAAPWLAVAEEPNFAELLGRAQAEMAAGHTASPPGDNVSETLLSMINILEQASPEQLGALDVLLRQLNNAKPATGELAGYLAKTSPSGNQPRDARTSGPDRTAPTTALDQAGQPTDTARTNLAQAAPGRPVSGTSPIISSRPAIDSNTSPKPAGDDVDTVSRQAAQHGPTDKDKVAARQPAGSALVATAEIPSSLGAAIVPRPEPADLPTGTTLPPSVQRTLTDRGDRMLILNDVTASRLLYQRAAEGGAGVAAFKLAQTYDPSFLTAHNLRGVVADPGAAEAWYRKAEALGDLEAIEALKDLAGHRLVDTASKH